MGDKNPHTAHVPRNANRYDKILIAVKIGTTLGQYTFQAADSAFNFFTLGKYTIKYNTKEVEIPKPKAANRNKKRFASSLVQSTEKKDDHRATMIAATIQATDDNNK
eukprot:scaffold22612_cov138-Cylindrotheca_fusiformis.AAC.4